MWKIPPIRGRNAEKASSHQGRGDIRKAEVRR
jgi:hypothetical protein